MELVAQQMAERRERILEAARHIIAEAGYEALTMRDLARESRVTVPTIYNLIGSKEEVLFAAVEEQTRRFVAGIESSRGTRPATRLLSVVESCVRELLRLPRYYRTLLMLIFTSEAAAEVRREVNRALGREFERAVEGLREAGDLLDWVDSGALVERLRVHLAFTSLQWASGQLGAEEFRRVGLYEASLLLCGATTGEGHDAFARMVRKTQQGESRGRRRNGTRRRVSNGR